MSRLFVFLLILGFSSAAWAEDAAPQEMNCRGPLVQGGFVICRLPKPDGVYRVNSPNGGTSLLSAEHPVLIPFSRNSALEVTVTAASISRSAQWGIKPKTFTLTRGNWSIERIDGLPPGKVTPRTLEQQRKVEADWIKKQAAWKNRAAASWYTGGFIEPVENARISGEYGSQRFLNGKPKNPHLGMDFAVPEGTKIVSPAQAVVVLAEPDMYFEGGLLVLDHGEGVMSVMLHMSRIDVKIGDTVQQGETVGAVGMTGRATGPHLHWGIKVRGTYINPELALAYQP